MKLQDKIIGIAGVVLILFSIVYYSIQNIWDTVNWISLILGIIGFACDKPNGGQSGKMFYDRNCGIENDISHTPWE